MFLKIYFCMHHGNRSWRLETFKAYLEKIIVSSLFCRKTVFGIEHVQSSLIFSNIFKYEHSEKFQSFLFHSFNFIHSSPASTRWSFSLAFIALQELLFFIQWPAFVHSIQSYYITLTHRYRNRKDNRRIINNRHSNRLRSCRCKFRGLQKAIYLGAVPYFQMDVVEQVLEPIYRRQMLLENSAWCCCSRS